MKKLLLILVIVVLAGLLAAPAFAYQPPPTMTTGQAWVIPRPELWGGNFWVELVDDEIVFRDSDAEYIPADYDVWMLLGWVGATKGTLKSLPAWDRFSFELTGPSFDALPGGRWSQGESASRAHWSVSFFAGTGPAFNRPEVPYYERDLYWHLGSLEPGYYSGTTKERLTRTVADLTWDFGIGDEWVKHAQQTPMITRAFSATYSPHFTIAAE